MKGELHPTENRACEADFLGTAGGGAESLRWFCVARPSHAEKVPSG